MKITIKVLKGEECSLEVTPEMTILELKTEVEKILKIPAIHQKLVLAGRGLSDDNTIGSYPSIKDGSKLNMIVKKPDPLKDVIYKCFRKHYNEPQTERLTAEFMLDFEQRVKQLSLDDIERLATSIMTQQQQTCN